MAQNFTAFIGQQHLVSGPLADVALAIKRMDQRASEPISIFDDETGRPIDLDLRGSEQDMLNRLPNLAPQSSSQDTAQANTPRGRGRPKLGVVAREVTLLPRHWEWLNAQPGGASVALRKLVEAARHANSDRDQERAARDAAYHFMSAMAGNLPGFEEAARALFAGDRIRIEQLTEGWPADIRSYAIRKAFG